jgi:4-diphosphocytidyl-2-C-methyl-D-erythritol kinase
MRTVRAPAKLNLILKVVGKRADGYHDLVSLMVPVNLTDTLTFAPGPRGITLSCRPEVLPKGNENLVVRAATAFYARIEQKPFLSITLTKKIPMAAGLGGGSSDAAATLKALNSLEGSPLDGKALAETALTLGADVPFFLQNLPAIARGVGEQLEPVRPWPAYWYVIVAPPLSVSTAWAYGNLKLELTTPENGSIVNPLRNGWTRIGDLLENDLETVTAARYPIIGHIKSLLLEAGAEGALMSGSGPSVFGVFRSEETAKRAKKALSSRVEAAVFALQDFRDSAAQP